MSLFSELRRRNVFRIAAAYLVVGWLLTEVLTAILPELGAPDWLSRAVILIFAFGFLPAVGFAWVFELTPEGIKRDYGAASDEPGSVAIRKRFDHIAIGTAVVLIIVVGLFSARQTTDDNGPVQLLASASQAVISNASVAVLPFVNMSNDQDNEYFSDGLTETLLHMLTQIPELKVAARTSSFAFKGKSLSIQEIARSLEVAHVLEGSVQRAGDRVRITAQLIRASDGYHVWSSKYDREVDDIFGIQDEIAQKVGYALSESLLGAAPVRQPAGLRTTDADAYDLYLQARKERVTYSYSGLQATEDLLKGALLIDPDFIEAKTELATSYVQQLETGLMDDQEAYLEIIAITDQVLAERPEDPVALAASAFARTGTRFKQGDFSGAPELVRQLEEIVAAAPAELQPKILLMRAYQMTQQDDKAVELLTAALRQDPFNPTIYYELGTAYMKVGRRDDARTALEKSLEIEPAQPNAYTNLGLISLHSGDGVGYVTQFLKAIRVDPKDHELPGMLADFLYNIGLVEIGDDFRERVLAIAPTSEIAYHLELVRAVATGDEEAGIASARRAIVDNIEERRGSYVGAVRYLLRNAAQNNNVESESAWIDRHAPGILDIDAAQSPQKYRMAQGAAFDAWYTSLPREELLRRIEVLQAGFEQAGQSLEDNPYSRANILAMRGETEQAIEVALDKIFTSSVAKNLGWREMFSQPHFAELVADPRIKAAIQQWEDEESRIRAQVQSYFRDMQTTTLTAQNIASADKALYGVAQRAVFRQ
jgi:TolB-like protein/tetratricopeptide (TPR) repeat protein